MNTAVGSLLLARTPVGKAVFGFASGAIAVVIGHQVMVLILYLTGFIPNAPYSFASNPRAFGLPVLVNNMFWGGLWGILFAFVVGFFPRGWATWMKGLAFGLGIHVFLGNWIVVALIRGQPLFSGLVPQRMLIGGLIGTAFGLAVAYVHAALTGRFAR
jgi:hypothetical protein